MSSPTKGRGLAGVKRTKKSSHESLENPKPSVKPRKKKPAKKKINRPKQRGRYKPKKQAATEDALPPVGVRDADLAECIFSDEEERVEFLKDCPQDLPSFKSPTLSPPSPQPQYESNVFHETDDVIQDFSASFGHSSEGGISYESEELARSYPLSTALFPQPWMSQSASSKHALELSATGQSETQGSTGLYESTFSGEDTVSDTSDVLQSTSTANNVSDSMNTVITLPSIGDEGAPSTPVILKTVDVFKDKLPPNWLPFADQKGIHLFRFSTSNKTPMAVQREIFLPHVGVPKISVHCQALPFKIDLLKSVNISKIVLNSDSIDQFCSAGVSIARKLEQYTMCIAADLLELKEVWGNFPNSIVDKNLFQEEKYTETCRSTSCSLLIPLGQKGKRCAPCVKLLRTLKNRKAHLLSENPHPSTTNIYLTYEQALAKLKLQHEESKKKEHRIAYLEGKFRDLLDKEGVNLETKLSTDLANILANSKLTQTQEVFFREQFNCSVQADPRHAGTQMASVYDKACAPSSYDV